MVDFFRDKLAQCEKSNYEEACNELILDMVYYLVGNKWSFVLGTVPTEFDENSRLALVVIRYENCDDGFIKPIGFYIDKENGECEGLEDISYDEKINFIKQTIPLIPELE